MRISDWSSDVCSSDLIEVVAESARGAGRTLIDSEWLETSLSQNLRRFDKGGDAFYDQISALHKAVRGSDPDAALYWFARMLDGGADPRYLSRQIGRASCRARVCPSV